MKDGPKTVAICGPTLTAARRAVGLTQTELAERCATQFAGSSNAGSFQTMISRMEVGGDPCSPSSSRVTTRTAHAIIEAVKRAAMSPHAFCLVEQLRAEMRRDSRWQKAEQTRKEIELRQLKIVALEDEIVDLEQHLMGVMP